MFTLDNELLKTAKSILIDYKNIYWIIGGSCSGKSTICKNISKEKNMSVYDMDEHIFGKYMGRYTMEKHPASKTWFSAKNALDWSLSLSWEEFHQLNKAANAEYLELFAEDMQARAKNEPLLVDGGISYPSVLAQVFPIENIVCLSIPSNESRELWENAIERKSMKEMILNLPHGDKKWETFLFCDKKIGEISVTESQGGNIKVFPRTKNTSVKDLSQNISNYFNL